jgi:hypothetical protein
MALTRGALSGYHAVMRLWLFLIVIAGTATGGGCQTVNTQTPALVEYERSGGITGQTVRLVIQDNGSARLFARAGGDSTTLAVGADALERLKSLLQNIRFDTLRAEYRPSQAGADLYEYVITHRGRSVRCQDGAVPAELQPLIGALNEVVRSRPPR